MKKMIWCLATLGAVAFATPASASSLFSGPYAPANWTTTLTNSDGSVNTAGAPGSITVLGTDNGSFAGGNTLYTTTAAATGTVGFDWSYTTTDGPFWDPAGFYLNGVFTPLTNPFGFQNQGGSFAFAVNEGDTFGFYASSLDNIFGRGNLTISNFDAPTPEPATLAVFGMMAAGAGAYVRRRKVRA